MNLIRLYGRFISVYLRSKTEYGIYYFMDLVMNIFYSFLNILIIWVLLQKFGTIHDWNFYQVIFLYNINYFSFALSSLFVWNPSREIESMISEGSFDGMLVKPLNPLPHMVLRQFSHGHLVQVGFGLVVFIICFGKLGIDWNILKALWFVLVIIGASLIQAAIMMIAGAMSFWFVKSTAFVEVVIYQLRNFLDYPVSIYDKWVQVMMLMVIPYSFVNFFPSQYFLNKSEGYLFHPAFQFATPFIGLILFLIALSIWNVGINKYQGTGS